jgi:hypothetical protein
MAEVSGSRGFVPEPVMETLADRVARIRRAARGRVLELNGSDPTGEGEGRYDTVISLVRVPYEPDLDSYVATMVHHLSPGGCLYLLEPTVRTGPLGRPSRRRVRSTAGVHVGRDVPRALRNAGLFVTDLDRFVVPDVPRALALFVDATARFPTEAPPT